MPFDSASQAKPKPVLVIGGGITGQRAAIDLADAGLDVLLIEREASLGGTVAQLGLMFPLHNCLLCRGDALHGPGCTRPTISAQLLDRSRPENLSVWTQSQLATLEGKAPDLRATIRREPRYVDPARCINCDRCAQACPQAIPDPFQAGLAQRKAAYKPALRAVPDAYAIAKGDYCVGCGRCVDACPTAAINLDQASTSETVAVSAVVVASGMRLYDAALSQEYGYGRFPNVFTGLEMERMTSPAGPGEGRILRRSDGLPPVRIAWFQCVGSRDETHDYCSAFCCMYATRQAILARQLLPDAQAHIYLMDDRVFSKSFSATYDPLRAAYDIHLTRCRPSVLQEDPATHDLILQATAEDGRMIEERFGMVVLSIGAEAASEARGLARTLGLEPDAFGFIRTRALAPVDTEREGVFVAGAAAGPADVCDSVTQGSAAAARVRSFLRRPAATRPTNARPVQYAGERRLGVFVCDCAGEIGAVVDLAPTMQYVSGLTGVAVAQVVPFGCLRAGLEAMRQVVQRENLTDVVIGGCNRRTYSALFARELAVPLEFANLREECALVHRDDPPGATRQAKELLRVAVERARRRPRLEPLTVEPTRAALVVGGGLAGLTAALHLADAGIPVHLVEREPLLGGHALRLGPTPEGEDIAGLTRELIARAQAHAGIAVHTSTEVTQHSGRLGQFTATLRSQDGSFGEKRLQVGATVVATGGAEYRGPAFGLGASDQILTLLDLDQRLAAKPELPSRLRQATFISCVGPWNEPGGILAWRCSRTCCEAIIKHARALKEANPSCQVVVLHREVNTYTFREEQYTLARRAGVLFIRYGPSQPPQVEQTQDGLRVTVMDMALHEELALRPGLLVLAAAILPHADAALTAARLGIPQSGEGFFREWEAKTRSFASLEPGVFLCGLGHGPKPTRETIAQALAAAEHAIALLLQEKIVLSPAVAQVDQKRCMGCLNCVRVCPYSVPRIDIQRGSQGNRGKSYIDPARCQGCGTCVSDCPGKAIRMAQYEDEQIVGENLLGQWLVAS
jgi:heterodisulfide reductase subunit A